MHFQDKFRFKPELWDGCHNIKIIIITKKSMSSDDVAIVTVRDNIYGINFWFVTKRENVNRMKKERLI